MNKEELEKFPYFTGKMLKAFINNNYPSTTITRWKGKINKIEKGKYTIHNNSLIYATVIVTPSYCSFRSALYYYQLTEQIPVRVQVAVKKRKRSNEKIQFIRIKEKDFFGYKRVRIQDFDFFIAEKEKLLLDCLLYPHAGVMPDELLGLLSEDLDKDKIIDYLEKINNINVIKRAGYLLEKSDIKIF